jgi:hypothetical protein
VMGGRRPCPRCGSTCDCRESSIEPPAGRALRVASCGMRSAYASSAVEGVRFGGSRRLGSLGAGRRVQFRREANRPRWTRREACRPLGQASRAFGKASRTLFVGELTESARAWLEHARASHQGRVRPPVRPRFATP